MTDNLKEMAVVLAVAMAVFLLAKPLCLRFMTADDFARRRNVWLVLTATAFISPSFWQFCLVAVPLVAWSGGRDSNPVAFYLLFMHVIPPDVSFDIPVVGIQSLFELDCYRILSFTVLLPAAWRLMRSPDKTRRRQLTTMDGLLLAFGVLQLVLFMPYESITNTMRRGFLFFIDVFVLYFVVSRTCTTRHALVEAMASFFLACAIFAPLALFESLRGYLLYEGIADRWGKPILWAFLFRGDTLRAQVSAGHSIALGYILSIAFGFWLYLRSRVQSWPLSIGVTAWMWAGLLAAYSRAPWITALVIFFSYLALRPSGATRFLKALLASALVAAVVLVSPIGKPVIDNLPFVGTIDTESVDYRVRLAEVSWPLILKNPLFGDPFVLMQLESLREAGGGIVDLVNTYLSITIFYGVVGLCLFLGPFVVGIRNARLLVKSSTRFDADLSLLGVTLIACMLGTLLMMATLSFGTSLEKMFYVLAGLAAGYAQLGQLNEPSGYVRTALATHTRHAA